MAKINIKFMNGSNTQVDKPSYWEAMKYCRNCISYSGGRVARVEVDAQAVWDHSWDQQSQLAGLRVA